jgi:ATP-dependent DNA helicase RecQ
MRAVQRTSREALGFDLRPEQREAVEAVVGGHDTLVVMPTGSGKSAIYQVAALLVDGPTVIVSPLIALQRDQVEAIEEAGAGEAAALNSARPVAQRRETLERFERNELEFLFLAPEQLANDETLARVADARPSLLVVDEAHCISEWGHDFRPEYLRLGAVAEALGRPTVLALTATASPPVRAEIVERLGLRDPHLVVRGFDRPNLHLAVETFQHEDAKREALLGAAASAPKPGIVYAATRATAEAVAAALEERGLRAGAYHAGLRQSERETTQQRFMDDALDVIVATTAFGMGVDKPNVRFVFHHDVADSVDAYYQEIGRAGRDGDPADARLFYRPEDLGLRRFFAAAGNVDAAELESVAAAVAERDGPVEPRTLQDETGLGQTKLGSALSRLEEVGAVTVLPSGEIAGTGEVGAEELEAAAAAQEHRRSFDRSRVEMMRGYAEVRDCRRGYLLNYFGEQFDPPCGNCDNCDAGIVEDEPQAEPFALGSRVRHDAWGEGTVQRYEADKMVVLFDDAGYKTLAVDLVLAHDLLVSVE